MADDENLGKDFKKAVSELTKANKELKSANEKLVERGGLAEAGKEIHKTWTSTWTGMKDTLVGSLGPVGKIGESLISGIIGKSKQKKEEELLAKQLGIGVEEMRAMAKQKQILDAQEEAQKKFEAAAEAMGIPDDVWKNTIDHQTQMAEVAIGKLTGDADFVQNQQDKQWVANLDKKAAEEKANIEERHKKELEVAKSAEISEENLRKLEDQHIQELANADKKLIDEKERMAAEGEKGFKTQEEFLAEQKKNAELSDAEAEQRAQDLYNTQVGIITEGEKEEKTDDPQTKAAEESLKTVQDFYKELREDMTVPATEAWAQAKELFTKQNAAVEEQKKTTELEKETAEKGADVVDAQKELDTELKKLTDQVNMGLITQEQFTKAQQKATEEFAAQEAAAAAKKEEVKTDVSDGGTERIEDTAEAFAAAIAEQAQRSADTPDPKPEVIPTNGKGDLDAKALEELARKQLEEQAEFNKMAGKAGSIFVHDTSVEDAIADQNKQGGAAAQEVANEQRRKDDKLIDTLDEIAENTEGGGGAGAGAGAGGGGDGGGGGKFGGIGGGIANIGKGLGKGLGGILRGIAQGLIFWANPLVPLGAAALAAAIAVIGAGIAGATWIVGKSLPTFAEGMKSFEDLDGEALIDAGKGMAAVAGGMAAFGVGTAVAGLGSLVGGITSGIVGLFGGDDPLTKMEKFQAYDFDEVKIKSNAAAMVAYSTGMAALGGATALAGVGLAIGAVGGAIAGLFGAENPLDKMLKFQAYTFDTEKIKTNAAAVKAYAEAIKDFPTAPSASVFTAAKDAIIGLLGGDTDPFAPMKKFGELVLNEAGIKTNAGAVKAYAEAVKDFPSSPSASVFTAAKNAIIGLLGGDTDPFAPMKAFGDLVLNTEQIKTNAGAVKAYAEAVKDFPSSPAASVFTAAKNAIIELLGGDIDPFAPLKAFGLLKLDTEQIKINAAAVKAYAEAVKDFPSSPAASVFKAAKDAIIGLLGGETDPFAPLKAFGLLTLDTVKITSNAAAVKAYAEAVKDYPAAPAAGVLTAAKNAVIDFLGGETDPFAPLKRFGELTLDTAKITANAAAVKVYGEAVKDYPAAPAAGVLTAAKNAVIDFLGGDTDPFAPLKKFGELVLNTEQIKTNAAAVIAYSNAIKDMPAAPAAGVITAAKNAVIDLLGGETDPFVPLKKFSDLVLNKEQIITNAGAVKAYGEAIKDMPAAPEASVLTAAKDAIVGLLGGKDKDPFAPLKEFGDLKLDAAQIAINAEAVSAFGIAMENMPEVKGERAGGLLGAIGNFFGGEKKMPWDQVKAFAEADMGDTAKLQKNAEALTAFGLSLSGLKDIPTDIEDRLKGLGNGLEEFAKYIDDGEIETITEFADAMAKFPIGTFSGGSAGKGGGAGAGNGGDGFGLLHTDLVTMTDLLRTWDMQKLVEPATELGSLYVHDEGIHDRLDILTGQDFWRQVSLMNAAVTAPTTNGASMTVVNNTSMAGGQTTSVNTSINTLVGTTDPHTQLAMVY